MRQLRGGVAGTREIEFRARRGKSTALRCDFRAATLETAMRPPAHPRDDRGRHPVVANGLSVMFAAGRWLRVVGEARCARPSRRVGAGPDVIQWTCAILR